MSVRTVGLWIVDCRWADGLGVGLGVVELVDRGKVGVVTSSLCGRQSRAGRSNTPVTACANALPFADANAIH